MAKRSSEIVSKNMSHIRSTDTTIERQMRSALLKLGYRFRKNYSKLPGKPDIVMVKEKIAVFCDSDFWHGKNWKRLQKRLVTNTKYWVLKIERNRSRDRRVSKKIRDLGWKVFRFWESDIKKNINQCVRKISTEIEKSNSYSY